MGPAFDFGASLTTDELLPLSWNGTGIPATRGKFLFVSSLFLGNSPSISLLALKAPLSLWTGTRCFTSSGDFHSYRRTDWERIWPQASLLSEEHEISQEKAPVGHLLEVVVVGL